MGGICRVSRNIIIFVLFVQYSESRRSTCTVLRKIEGKLEHINLSVFARRCSAIVLSNIKNLLANTRNFKIDAVRDFDPLESLQGKE